MLLRKYKVTREEWPYHETAKITTEQFFFAQSDQEAVKNVPYYGLKCLCYVEDVTLPDSLINDLVESRYKDKSEEKLGKLKTKLAEAKAAQAYYESMYLLQRLSGKRFDDLGQRERDTRIEKEVKKIL